MRPAIPIILGTTVFLLCSMCKKDPEIVPYKTQHVIVVIVDGARYQETWGNGELQYIPERAAISANGCICTNFYNTGFTFTNAGHTSITTGVDQMINNSGFEYPQKPGIFQYFRQAKNAPADKTWIISTKDKLHILSDCYDSTMAGQFRPSYDCGINGPFTGYRDDSTTFAHAMNIFQTYHPDLVLINFKEPDASGHANSWTGYLDGIRNTDDYVGQLWDYIQNDPYYKGTTTLFVTNDHGRHDDGWLDEFVSHGDNCNGCRHIELLAIGPDFKENYVCTNTFNQRDLCKTISQLLLFPMPTGTGQVMTPLFK